MDTIAYALSRVILVSAVLLALLFAWNEVYHVAAGFALALAAYAYLLMWGDLRIEDVL